ncbi:DUF1360 domain-containing protein [Radiobacillus kanasensis]|uniref:DUF1360 domain-containing protein n=1 Tax=Radiobacillus kanasensis TaxID=2844358 RepID=UPI001E284008|nr:DUF1360 domain-containing protein [Radiobacillus kanasensis]UFT99694.1 DUF1360 domain-containing protein [Radiobacillus kanasensis]
MTWFGFVLLALASFRFTHLLVYDQITKRLRDPFIEEEEEELSDGTVEVLIHTKGTGVRKFVGELLSCHWCTGIWSAAILYGLYVLLPGIATPIIMILAIAGLAAIIQTLLDK